MNRLFGKEKAVRTVGLIIVFGLFSANAFCTPGKRTYVGWDKGAEITMHNREDIPLYAKEKLLSDDILEEEVDTASINEQEVSGNITQKVTMEKPVVSETENSYINKEVCNVSPVRELHPINEASETDVLSDGVDTIEQRTESAVFQPIDDSHIPLKWEYKMKE